MDSGLGNRMAVVVVVGAVDATAMDDTAAN